MKKTILLLSLIVFCAPFVLGDVILFKDGTKVEGKVTEIVNGQVGIQGDSELYYVSQDKIAKIIYVKPVKEDDTMKWVIGGSLVLMCVLGFSLAMWGRNLQK